MNKSIFKSLVFSILFSLSGNLFSQFVENKGQVLDENNNIRSDVQFTVNNIDSKLFFHKNKITYVLYEFYKEENEKSEEATLKGDLQNAEMLSLRIKQQNIDFEFLNSNENVEVIFENKENHYVNYYTSTETNISNVPVYSQVTYKNLYDNIDIIFKSLDGKIKYDIILYKGAKLSDIKFRYNGVDDIIFDNEKIIFKTQIKDLVEEIPLSFFKESNKKIDVNYVKHNDNSFGFETEFDEVKEDVVIDPTLTWATIMERTTAGGASFIRGNIITDDNGNFFYQINTYNPDLPIANPGGLVYLDPNYNPASGLDIYFAKFDINRTMVWSTYLGGTDGNQSNYYDHGLATYGNSFYICGVTNSTNFPVVNQGGGAYYIGTAPSGQKGFLSKFNITSGQMIHSTYLNAYGQFVMDVNDVNGNIAISSFNYTWSVAPNVLSKVGAYNQGTHAGNSDIFLYEFNNSMNQIWGTFVGGASYEEPMGIQYDNLGNLFMFNRSGGAGTPVANPGGTAYFDNSFADKYDFWLVRFNTTGAMTWSTYYGGMGLEGLSYSQVTCNDNNEVIFTSTTRSTVMSLLNPGGGAYYQTTPTGLTDGWGGSGTCAGFIMRFNNTGTLLHGTYMGENSTENYIQGQSSGNCNEHYLLLQARNFATTPLAGSYNVGNAMTAQYNYMPMKMNSNFGIEWASYVHSDSNFMERIHADLVNGRLYTTGSFQARDFPFTDPGGGAYFDGSYSNALPARAYAIMEFDIGGAPTPSVTSGGSSTICSGASASLSASGSGTINWYTVSSGGTPFATGSPIVVSPTSTTTYYVESVNGGCVSPRSPITITVNPAPAAPVISSNSPVCVNGTINLTANTIGSATYNWSGPNSFSSSSEDPSIPFATTAMAGVYSCFVTIAGCNSSTANTSVTVNTNSTAPTSISGTATICSGSSTTLTLVGGSAGTGATAQWYSGSCGGTLVGTGNSITVSPTSNTTYFVRYSGTCNTTTCASQLVTVNTNSTAPTGISGTTSICSGNSTTLTVSGGTVGSGATAQWYTGSCGGTLVGTGNSITVSPTSNTTYFVRYSGTCNTTTCASQLVTVNTSSVAPTSITGTTSICAGNSTTLTVSGGTLGTGGVVQWYTGSCGGTLVSTGNSITVSPLSNTTYYVRYSGTCNTTACVNTTVTLNTNSVAPTSISGTATICSGNSTTLTLVGGTAGTGATAEWFTGSCGGTPAGTGNSITVSPTSNTTYFVRYSGTCNTTTCASQLVTVNTSSVAPTSISGTTTICSGNSTTLTLVGGTAGTGATAEWFTGSCGGTPAGTGNSITVSPTSNTTYYVRYAGSCNTTTCASQLVTVNTNSTAPTSISGTATICSGNSTTLTLVGGTAGTGATAEWFTGSCGGTPAGTGNSITVSPTSNTTYYVRYVGTCNTTTCASQLVTVNTNSTAPTSISGTTTICSGNSTTLTLVGGTVGTGATAEWFTGSCGGTPAGTGNSITVSPTSNTTYFVRYAGTCNTTTCASQLITVNSLDDATFSYSGGTFCLTGTDPSATITGTTGGTFTVNNGGVIDASTGEIDLAGSGLGSYTITYTTGGTCPDVATFDIQITSAPDATFSYTGTPYCEGSGTASVTFAAGASGGVFSSTAGLIIDSGTGEIDLNTSTPGIYTVENNIVASGGCAPAVATTSVEIIVQDDATFTYSGTTFCLSGSNPVANITGTPGGNFTINNGGTIDVSTGEVDLVGSGINSFTVTYTTLGTCPDVETFDIQITSAPDATFSYTGTPYCEGSGTASVTFAPGASGGVFSSTAGLIINSGNGEIDLNTSTPGIYTVENNIVASGGCAAAVATTSVEIIAQDDASFTYASTTFCENETNPTASITGTTGGTFTATPAGLSINATTGEIDLTTSTLNATYTVTYTTTGTCPDDQDFSITLNESPTAPTVTSDATGNTICEGESVEIDASGSGTGITYNVYDAISGGNLLGTTPLTVSPTVDTDYFVEAVNANSCGNVGGLQTISVTVNPLPSVDAGIDETICPGDNVTLTATGTGSVVWSTSETTASITVAPSSDAIYTVTLTDANNCSNSDDVTVSVVNIGGSLVAVDDNYSVTTEVSTNFDVISNDTYSGTSISIIDDPTSGTATENIDGTIDYISNAGFVGTDVLTYSICDVFCVNICDTATVTITVVRENDFGVPGGFSPNGDNINDIFVINGLDAYPNNNLTIFNRWGSMVFEANPYNNDWDGSPNVGGVLTGDKVTTGTYFYILDLGNDTEPLRGSIEVKRD